MGERLGTEYISLLKSILNCLQNKDLKSCSLSYNSK